MKNILGITKNNIPVFDGTQIGCHVHPSVLPFIGETIAKTSIKEDETFVRLTVDMERPIGVDHCIETNEGDEIVFFKRGNRNGESRFVLNKEAKSTSEISLILVLANEGEFNKEWVVLTAFEGIMAPKEPWDRFRAEAERSESENFWSNHALVPTEDELNKIKKGE